MEGGYPSQLKDEPKENGWEVVEPELKSYSHHKDEKQGDVDPAEVVSVLQSCLHADADKDREIEAELDLLPHWKDLKEIPNIVVEFELLQNPVICSITKRPIRFVVKPDAPIEVYYEHAAIERWLQENPHTPPPDWPEYLEFSARNSVACESIQKIINEDLEDIANQT